MKGVQLWVKPVRQAGVFLSVIVIGGFLAVFFCGEMAKDEPTTWYVFQQIAVACLTCLIILPWTKIRNRFLWWPLFILLSIAGSLASVCFLFLRISVVSSAIAEANLIGLLHVLGGLLIIAILVLQIPAIWLLKYRNHLGRNSNRALAADS